MTKTYQNGRYVSIIILMPLYLNVLLILAASEQMYKIISVRTKVKIYLLYDFGKTFHQIIIII